MFLQLSISLLTAAHLAAAGLAACGPLLAAGLRLTSSRLDEDSDAVLHRLACWSVGALVAAGGVGLTVGMWRAAADSGEYAAMLRRFPGTQYRDAALELMFTLICYATWIALWRRWRLRPWRHGLVAFVGATNLLYHFPPLMIVQGMLVDRPELVGETIVVRKLFLRLVFEPEVISRTMHFWGAGLVVSAVVAVAMLARPTPTVTMRATTRRVAMVGLAATALQWVTGLMTLVTLPAGEIGRLMGESPLAASCFAAGVLIATILLYQWAALVITPIAAVRKTSLLAWVASVMILMAIAARVATP